MSQIPNVTIVLDGMESHTDANGVTSFYVDAGTYSWSASKAGYNVKSGSVNVAEAKTLEVTLVPTEIPPPPPPPSLIFRLASSIVVGLTSYIISGNPKVAVVGGVVGGILAPSLYSVSFLDSLTPQARVWLEKRLREKE